MQSEVTAKAAQATDAAYISLLIAIILLSGGLGGVVNYFQAKSDDPERASLQRSLVVGVAAAFLVPLFLQMISSDLLARGAEDRLRLFVFAGFCIVAAISSKAFVSSIADRVLKEVKETKQEAKEAKTQAEAAQSVAASAQSAAADAQGAASSAKIQAQVALAAPDAQAGGGAAQAAEATPDERLELLAGDYQRIRDTMKRGPIRTGEMTKVIRQMIDLAPSARELSARDNLANQGHRGRRLAAFAYLYAKPDFGMLEGLVDSVVSITDEPFGQYWGVLAISKVIGERDKTEIPARVVEQLKELYGRLKKDSDRAYELSRILTKQLGVNLD